MPLQSPPLAKEDREKSALDDQSTSSTPKSEEEKQPLNSIFGDRPAKGQKNRAETMRESLSLGKKDDKAEVKIVETDPIKTPLPMNNSDQKHDEKLDGQQDSITNVHKVEEGVNYDDDDDPVVRTFGKKDDSDLSRGEKIQEFFLGKKDHDDDDDTEQSNDAKEDDKQPPKDRDFFFKDIEQIAGLSNSDIHEMIGAIKFFYAKELDKFTVNFSDTRITHVSLSEQIGYILGFEDHSKIINGEDAKYGYDLAGGFSTFAVYCRGLTENIVIGNQLSSLLGVVTVSGGGKPGNIIEKIYDSPIFLRVLPREINELQIELRTLDSRPVPFQYGTVLRNSLLIFRKIVNF